MTKSQIQQRNLRNSSLNETFPETFSETLKYLLFNIYDSRKFRYRPFSVPFNIVFLIFLFARSLAQAQFVGTIKYGGTGCPQGTLTESIAQNGRVLILTPDNFSVESSTDRGKSMDRRSCNLSIPIQVPEYMQVALSTVISGSGSKSEDGSLRISQTLFNLKEAPVSNVHLEKELVSGEQSLHLNSRFDGGLTWSDCGQGTVLRTNMILAANGNAYGAIDAIEVRLHFRTCPDFPTE